MSKRRRRKGKDYPLRWAHVHLLCACRGGNTVAIGVKALEKYAQLQGDDRVMKCPTCRKEATWEVVDDEER
jgi:hypothetical protein